MGLIQVEYGAHLFRERKFKDAFGMWEVAYVDPVLVLTRFPSLVPKWLLEEKKVSLHVWQSAGVTVCVFVCSPG